MAIRVALHHVTHYHYDRPVILKPQTVRLRPAPHCRTPILSYSLKVEPATHFLNWQQDPYSNYLARLTFPEMAQDLRVEVSLIAEMISFNPFDFFTEEYAENFPFEYEPHLKHELGPYLATCETGPLFHELTESLRHPKRTIDILVDANTAIRQRLEYILRMEAGIQAPEETLTKGRGSCRDFAWLLVQVLRHLGLAARFASGYSIQLKADVQALDGPSGVSEDCVDLHAWAEVYVPGAGWIGLDATSAALTEAGHIPLACAADPTSAAPISGYMATLAEAEMTVAMSVTRINEAPRVTKPYDDAQWAEIIQLGQTIDKRLKAADVRLTMGGEPTFVSLDDVEGDEWNTAPLGENKRKLAGRLLKRLAGRYATNPVFFYGQGKHYPGESLPRWALSCIWRKDHTPLWNNPELLADEEGPPSSTDPHEFLKNLARVLNVDPKHIAKGYEDPFYFLWRERNLPVNVTPEDNKLNDPEERKRLARVFEQGLDHVVGYALPLQKLGKWHSDDFLIRTEHLLLIPGDSAMGYRLPLNSLPDVDPLSYPYLEPPDPIMQRGPQEKHLPEAPPRTAITAEVRNGRLYVFLPPLQTADDWIELVTAIEKTRTPVILEGYGPPYDPILEKFSITPDPGVIEVNIHPSATWDELVAKTETLYEEARQCRLGTEKFMLDGRHSGTGGGNHILLGGITPKDSPLLRKPSLLKGLLAYWLNHPSLSYLFSSLFIGPTSQAPRLDEARSDSLYELDIAFAQLPADGDFPLWHIDRALRHLLTDSTGNTHRAEFCIDKLYSPDSASGRLGLVELRSFEMPPHARMSLTQQLLLRALTAWLWEHNYEIPPIRWGTRLHDRFMLPHFIKADFQDVIRDVGMKWEWFVPHYEFRFPFIGSYQAENLELELRTAIEPWHVLGEEPGMGGAVRYVDSSLERLQVLVKGMTESRHQVTCNGRPLPLHSTGRPGEFVAGVRFRAWQPPSCLHPTIGVHSPLTFDLYDTWSGRSVGGCVYHVAHPGGRSYDTFPTTASEAEGRRNSRFQTIGHSPAPYQPIIRPSSPEHPLTLDLRT